MKFSQNTFKKKKIIIHKKIDKYRNQLSKQLSLINNIPLKSYKWSCILDSWLYHVISIILISIERNKTKKLTNTKHKNDFDFTLNDSIELFDKKKIKYVSYLIDNLFSKKKIIKPKVFVKRQNICLRKTFFNNIVKIFIYFRKPILITDAYFSPKDKIKIFLISLGRIFITNSNVAFNEQIITNNFKNVLRNSIKVKEEDNIDKIFNAILKNTLPKNFLENFNEYNIRTNFFLKNIKILGSGISIHTSDFYKILASKFLIKKKPVLGFQHGFSYNLTEDNITEQIEKRNSSKFFYWNDRRGLGLNHLNKFKEIKKIDNLNNSKIYFFPDTTDTEFYYFDYFMLYRETNINVRKKNYINLCNNIKQKFFFNIKSFNREEKNYDFLKKKGIKIVSNKNVNKILCETKIFISDVFSTATIEALYSNVPTILILKHELNKYGFKKKTINTLNNLKKFGFIQKNSKLAGKFLSKNYDNIEKYWNDKKFQQSLNKLKKELYTDNVNFISEINKYLINYKKKVEQNNN